MIPDIRRQLTLFVESNDAEIIEQVRLKYNPRQFELIKAHVTLCREDEIQNLEKIISNLLLLSQTEIAIEFAKLARFDNGKGLFLPAAKNNDEFEELRKQVLEGLSRNIRKQEPHITLMHPRNSTCTDNIFTQVEKLIFPTKLKFKRVSLIEQEGGRKWTVLKHFELMK